MANFPGLSEKPKMANRIFVNIKNGQIVVKDPDTHEDVGFSSITGHLRGITTHTATFNNSAQPMGFYDLEIVNGDVTYILSVSQDGGVARQLINSLASIKDFSKPIIIEPWMSKPTADKKPYQNVSVYLGQRDDAHRLKWAVELPKAQWITVGRQQVLDTSEVLKALDDLVAGINNSMPNKSGAAEGVKPTDVASGYVKASGTDTNDDLPF